MSAPYPVTSSRPAATARRAATRRGRGSRACARRGRCAVRRRRRPRRGVGRGPGPGLLTGLRLRHRQPPRRTRSCSQRAPLLPGSDNNGCHFWESPVEWPHVRPRHDRGGPGPRGPAAPAASASGGASRCATSPSARASPRARSRGWRTGSARPAWSCCCRWRRPTACRSTSWSAHRRSATPGSGSSPATRQRPDRSPAHPAARRRPGLEDPHPGAPDQPQPRAHDGYEWLYVLSGRMRLVLGDHDLVLDPGEAAEFDTQLPHWFGRRARAPPRS